MAVSRKSMSDYMLEKGYIAPDHLKQAHDLQKQSGGDLGKIIVENNWAIEKDVFEAKAAEMGLPFVDLGNFQPEVNATNIVPGHIAKRHNVMPVKKDSANNVLWVAMSNTNNPYAADDIRMASKCTVKLVLAAPGAIEEAIAKVYGGTAIEDSGPGNAATADAAKKGGLGGLNPFKGGMNPNKGGMNPLAGGGLAGGGGGGDLRAAMAEYGASGDMSESDDDDGVAQSEEAPIIRVANTIIQQAIKEGASDIHIEPDRRGLRIRYRVDGVLHETMTMPKYIQAPLISRFKILAEMNIAERRVPQDGRIPIKWESKDYDLRVSCLPSIYGEKIVCRILDKGSVMIGLNKLGFTPELQSQIEELVIQPNGMVLSTGPTGSGKTTTQYSILNKLNTIEKNILTIEDPCEYQLSGITQVQVNKKAGLTFASALRSFLRQDPDIIMVGEMRDLETADIAIESALTGHLVLSTLHTNDAPSAVIRLVDMGVEPFLISATIIGVMAQRLGRKNCQNCKEPYEVPGTDLRRFGFVPESEDQMVTLWRGRGCEMCRHTGYKGRLGFYSLMRLNDEVAELVVRRASLNEIRDAARANGMKELKEDGFDKVLQGITTPDEVMRVVFTAGH
jgi:type IV pilus assembly protein PilB